MIAGGIHELYFQTMNYNYQILTTIKQNTDQIKLHKKIKQVDRSLVHTIYIHNTLIFLIKLNFLKYGFFYRDRFF